MLKARICMTVGLIALLLSIPALAASDVVERTFPFRGGLVDIGIERGSVEVRTGTGGDVRVRIEASRGRVSDYLDVRFEEGDGLRIEGEEVRGGSVRGSIHFLIEAPEDIDLRIATDGGHVEVDDVTGEVEITTGGGHIEFGDVGRSLVIDTGGGHIQGGSVGDRARIETGGGHVEVEQVGGDLEVQSGGGHIEIGDVAGALEVRTGGGHLEAGHVMGSAALRSGGGHVGMAGCDGDVKVNTGGGRIELEEMAGFVFAHTGGGDIEVRLAGGNTAGVDLKSERDGDITVHVPAGQGFDLDAVASGSVEADPSLGFSGMLSGNRVNGPIGGGGQVLKLRADDGDIRIVSGR
ncbi:MAG: DUF4097 family beta strand repeat-containing protein [Acidobacteriota bacterium]